MKLSMTKITLLALCVAGLFGVLYTRSSGVKFTEHDRYERGVQRLKQLDTDFNVDVLKARFRLLNNYDGFSEQLDESFATLQELTNFPAFVEAEGSVALSRTLASFSNSLSQKQEMIEQFKTQNSVVRNSLNYFPIAGSELIKKAAASPDGRELELSFDGLMRELLVFSLTAEDELEPQIRLSMEKVRAWTEAHPNHADIKMVTSLLAHARAILSRKPKVDALTRQLVAIPTGEQADEMLHIYQGQFGLALQKTHAYRLALFGCSVLLLGGIAWAIFALRSANRHLEHRVAERTAELSGKNAALQESIAEQLRTSDALRSSEQRFRTLSTCSPVGIFETDATGICQYANPRCQLILGLTFEELVKNEWMKILHPEDKDRVTGEWKQVVAAGGELNSEHRFVFPSGEERWVHVRSAAVRKDENVVGHVGMVADITDRKKAEAERKAMELQLQQGQKLESIGRLAAGVAHEINTPTQYIGDNTRFVRDSFQDLLPVLNAPRKLLDAFRDNRMTAELLLTTEEALKKADVDYLIEEIPKAVTQSLEGIERVAKIVVSMKEFSHPGTTEKTQVDLNHAIDSTLTVARSEWKYVADLVTEFDATLPPVLCLPGEFNQVILNLTVNAAHAIADAMKDRDMTKGTITVTTKRDGDWAEVRVRDSGTGIPEHARAKIFDPFFTTKGVGKGTGQGLAIAHSVITDKHGGTIAFETEMGKGTVFIIRIPIAPAAKAATENTPEEKEVHV